MTAKDTHGWILMAFAAICLVGLFGVREYILSGPKSDAATNCLGTPVRNTVILIDHTDPLAKQTRDEIVHRSLSYIQSDQVQLNERVSVFTVSEQSKQYLQPTFSKCKPEKGRNRITEGANEAKKYTDNFEKPLKEALDGTVGTSKQSPIAQAIKDLSLKYELSGENNTLIVFSDMYENTEKFSLMNCTDPSRVVSDYKKSVLGLVERPTFKTTTIFINLNPPNPTSGTITKTIVRCSNTFWMWFFEDVGQQKSSVHFSQMP